MAHFAQLDENNIVINVIVTRQEDENEFAQIQETLGNKYVQTSYNTFAGVHKLGKAPLRKNFASIGFTYDAERDAFIPPKNYPSWVLNEETCQWEAPIPKPPDSPIGIWIWDEESLSWVTPS